MEITPVIGIGVGDLQQAARAEAARIATKSKGSVLTQNKLLIGMLHDRELVTDTEVTKLTRLVEIEARVGTGKITAKDGYFESRDLYHALLADRKPSAVALAVASGSVGSYSVGDGGEGPDAIKLANNGGQWETRGALTGALIGSAFGGPVGAALGAAVGGTVGAVVDTCLK